VERLEVLRQRLASADGLRAIARVMRTLSAVRIRRSREAAEAVLDYEGCLELALHVALRGRSTEALPDRREDGRHGAVVFGSDLGLAGVFNARVAELAVADLRRLPVAERGPVLAVGGRVAAVLEAAGAPPWEVLPAPGDVERVAELAQELALVLDRWRTEEKVERISVFHHHYLSGAASEPRRRQLLPLDGAWLAEVAARPWPTRVLPDSDLPWDGLLGHVVQEYLFAALVRAAAESMASEHSSRLLAMETALRRIDEHRESLNAELRDARHARITEELLEVAAGFAALSRPSDSS
jgi:F-type H+-transporting ATPase subunit gamma